jgi:hypothetical protein
LGNKGELSQNLPTNATVIPQLAYAIAYRKLDMAKYHKRTGADMIVYVDDEKMVTIRCHCVR